MTERHALIPVAHADDETLGVGGTIPKLARAGWRIEVVILSNGVLTVRGRTEDNREDAARACKTLGIAPPRFLGFADQYFDREPVADLANAVMALDLAPDLIVTHVETDLNQDHRITCEVAKIVGRPKRKPVAIIGCEIPGTTQWNGRQFEANHYVDITDQIERKIEAFLLYHNEAQDDSQPWSAAGLRTLARYHGLQSGVEYAEAFHVIRGFEGLLP
jgi:LmbE family N-acetylglucosaminyl deacetylase